MAIGVSFATCKLGVKDEDIFIVEKMLIWMRQSIWVKAWMRRFSNLLKVRLSTGAETAYKIASGKFGAQANWVPFELVTPDKKEYQAKYKKMVH